MSWEEQLERERLNLRRAELAESRKSREAQLSIEGHRYGKSYANVSDRRYKTAYAAQAGLGVWDAVKPILIGAFVLFMILGPGLLVVTRIFGSLNLTTWLLIIAGLLVLWRMM